VKFDDAGLIPVIALDRLTGDVRMVAWANQDAIDATLRTGHATFFSRSRNALWEKGESSGNVMHVRRVLVDCDEDTLVYEVDAEGPSCHTGATSCFFRDVDGQDARTPVLVALDEVLLMRKEESAEKSYTKSLYERGAEHIGAKVREEADELARALVSESDERVANEAADVLFHVMVGLRARGMSLRNALEVLSERFGTGGHAEKKARKSP
jgi:phosphoribosyl-ATP pyrophosphohydrolase/phosphoribosyl-AMP cyclohydrolase